MIKRKVFDRIMPILGIISAFCGVGQETDQTRLTDTTKGIFVCWLICG